MLILLIQLPKGIFLEDQKDINGESMNLIYTYFGIWQHGLKSRLWLISPEQFCNIQYNLWSFQWALVSCRDSYFCPSIEILIFYYFDSSFYLLMYDKYSLDQLRNNMYWIMCYVLCTTYRPSIKVIVGWEDS